MGVGRLGVGFAMCWITTVFVRAGYGPWGIAAHSIMGLAFGVQVVGIAACLRFTRRLGRAGGCIPVGSGSRAG